MKEYGLHIERTRQTGTEYVQAVICRREKGRDAPLGCSGDGESEFDAEVPKHMHNMVLDGLGIYGFVSDSDAAYIGHGIEYRSVFAIDQAKLGKMFKTIKRVNAAVSKAEAWEPGDKLAAFAAGLKLSFMVERLGERGVRPVDWRWMTVPEGRNRFRDLIEAARADTLKRLGKVA